MYTHFNTDSCYYPECQNIAINAHAISNKISLQSISENQHLKCFLPKQNSQYTKKPYFDNIGINEATASYIFCKKHDDIFEKLDTKGIFTVEDIILQTFRSLAILLNNEKNALLSTYNYKNWNKPELISIEEVKIYLQRKGYDSLIEHLNNDEILIAIKKKIIFEVSEHTDSEIITIDNLLKYLEYKLLPQSNNNQLKDNILNTLTTENMEYTLLYYITDFQMPVAINSLNKLIIKEKKVNYYITVIPFENKTVIIILIPNELLEFQEIVNKINNFFTTKLTILNFIEAIMASHDDWYVQPSIIDNLSEHKRNIFIEDCMFINERRFYNEYDLSIFDKLRTELCYELNNRNELEKVFFIPKRDEYKTRYKKMLEKIVDSSFI
ncbi:MAG: hypothetical protein C0626_09265 [Arcobacter sp.]|uniref:hypothetical protein n=1 Tax=uncultured Arcobacter sp. TaxID=165434 RepID=UPI000CB74F40|nr:hypothetical protein [uncultured Arcobacter sp.]PLY09186.1 MAG: hypothetical protein C0626_09265 [Arcobacter sp.]